MIWNVTQVLAMRSYSFSQAIDMFLVERHGGPARDNPVIQATLEHLFHALQDAGHTWGLEIHIDDCEVRVDPAEDGHMMDVVRLRWNPSTRGGLLIGGPLGGTVRAFDEATHKRSLRVLQHRPLMAAVEMWAPGDEVVQVPHDEWRYDYAGWSESRRLWVYRAVAPSGA